MKYVAQPNGTYVPYEEGTDLYKALVALPADRRPVFLEASNKKVKAYLAAQPTL
jgi:hypothetical protein